MTFSDASVSLSDGPHQDGPTGQSEGAPGASSVSPGSGKSLSPKNVSESDFPPSVSARWPFCSSRRRAAALVSILSFFAWSVDTLFPTNADTQKQDQPLSAPPHFSFSPSLLYGEARASPGKSRDFYRLLGVKRNATSREIDKAYRKLAKQYHPDVNPGNEEKFLDIAKAHEVLSNEEQRKKYDMFGEAGLGEGGGPSPAEYGGTPIDLSDLFGGMFGGGGGGGPNIKFSFGGGDGPTFGGGSEGFGSFFGGNAGGFQEASSGNASLYDAEDDEVDELGPQAVQRVVEGRDFVFFLALYNPRCRPCRQLKDEFVKAAKRMKGIVPFGAINCSRFGNISYCKEAQHYPTLLFFPADKHSKRIDYRGERTSAAMVRFLSENLPSTVVVLTDESIEGWISKDAQKPKVVLFTDKRGIPPLFKYLSYQMRNQVAMGVVFKNQKNLLKAFGEGLEYQRKHRTPTPGDKPLPVEIVFPSLFAVDDIDLLTGEWIDVKNHVNQELLTLTFSRLAAKARTASGVAFRELTARRVSSGECSKDDSQFCFVLLLPDAMAAALEPKDLFAKLTELAEKFKRDPLKICWVNRDAQPGFTRVFSLSAGQEIVFLAYRPKRKKYEVMSGPLTPASLESFVNDVVSGGKQLTGKLTQFPQLVGKQKTKASGHDEL
ncbi:UNVERIFIED_CONTAM: thioredoxin domain-containing protein [Hammondia hammondi]|eukprot:XP_008887413.1 thioredoxin domain-containing protein [Hammondia hammondi]